MRGGWPELTSATPTEGNGDVKTEGKVEKKRDSRGKERLRWGFCVCCVGEMGEPCVCGDGERSPMVALSGGNRGRRGRGGRERERERKE